MTAAAVRIAQVQTGVHVEAVRMAFVRDSFDGSDFSDQCVALYCPMRPVAGTPESRGADTKVLWLEPEELNRYNVHPADWPAVAVEVMRE